MLLQTCTQGFGGYLESFQFVQGVVCQFVDPVGFLTAGLFLWGAISLAIYVKQGSAIIPMVLLFQFGGVASSQMAGIATPALVLVVLAIPPGVAALLYYRYSR